MEFGRWIPLAKAARALPSGPGVFQVRVVSGLIRYPRGKSAMVHYGGGMDVGADAEAFIDAHRGQPLLIRFAHNMTVAEREDPVAATAALVARFQARFGTPPTIPPGRSQHDPDLP